MANVSLDNMLKAVLAVGNKEQNMMIPPSIFSDMYNTVTSLLLSALSQAYLTDSTVSDMLQPFMKYKKQPPKNGYVEVDSDFRNLLGLGISVKKDGGDCNSNPVVIDTETEFKTAQLKSGCQSVPIEMVSISEWDYRTTSTYNFPTVKRPIGCFFGKNNEEKTKIRVCPYDLPTIEIRYIRQEKKVVYGYIMQPDDTYLFDLETSVESEWTDAAFKPIFNAMVSLYSAYSRDSELTNWSQILTERGIL